MATIGARPARVRPVAAARPNGRTLPSAPTTQNPRPVGVAATATTDGERAAPATAILGAAATAPPIMVARALAPGGGEGGSSPERGGKPRRSDIDTQGTLRR